MSLPRRTFFNLAAAAALTQAPPTRALTKAPTIKAVAFDAFPILDAFGLRREEIAFGDPTVGSGLADLVNFVKPQ